MGVDSDDDIDDDNDEDDITPSYQTSTTATISPDNLDDAAATYGQFTDAIQKTLGWNNLNDMLNTDSKAFTYQETCVVGEKDLDDAVGHDTVAQVVKVGKSQSFVRIAESSMRCWIRYSFYAGIRDFYTNAAAHDMLIP